jgi:hypothetical protein
MVSQPKGRMHFENISFEVLTPVVLNNSIFWDITPCSALEVSRHFGGTCRSIFRVEESTDYIALYRIIWNYS